MLSKDTKKANKQSEESRFVKSRRKYLKAVGSSAMLAGLAGCSGNGSGGDGDSGGTTAGSGSDSGSNSNTFTVGAIYPFSGAVAETGQNIRSFIRSARDDVINQARDDLGPLVMAQEEGLSNHNATVEVVFADHRGDPGAGRSEAERLVQQEGIDMLVGGYHSSVTKTISQVAERESIPHVNFASSSPSLTQRNLSWFWRTGPHDRTYTDNMFQLMDGLNEQQDAGIESVAIIHEDSEFGSISAEAQVELAEEYGYEVVGGPIAYSSESVSSLESQVQRIQQANPDVLLPSSYLRDAQILMEDMQSIGYYPNMVLGQNAGFNQPQFKQNAELSSYACSRSTYAPGLAESSEGIGTYASLVEEAVGVSFNGVFIRAWGGFISAMYAVNQAESLEPGAIQTALNELSIERVNSGMAYGVRFDDNHQNEQASGVMTQYVDGNTNLIWPFELAKSEIVYPAPSWDER